MKITRKSGLLIALLVLGSCGGSSGGASSGLRLTSAADFTASASAALQAALKATTTGQCSDRTDPDMDDPILTDGLDCDGDGGIVAHITPSTYAIAFKRVSLISNDGSSPQIDFVPDTGALGSSEVVNFTEDDSSETVVTIDPADLSAGTYTGLEAEIYYFQMTMPVGGTTRIVRTYMSDDDFDSEAADRSGLGPHHQGDITYIGDDGTELGWVDDTWSDSLSDARGEAQNGAGGTDPETGHDRGFFGNTDLWNRDDLMQGAGQDIYLFSLDFDEPLEIPDPSTITDLTTITVTFSTADTFYYEDFGEQGTGFNPGPGEEASAETGEWAPLTPTAELSVESEE